MTRTLGITCSKDEILMAVADEGEIVEDPHEKLSLSAGLERTERLRSAHSDIKRTLSEIKPDHVRILLPEQTYKDSYARIAPRVTLEVLARLACADADIPVEMLHRASARSRLGVSKKGQFDDSVTRVVGPPVGKYWNRGRKLAAAAALADPDS
jgi:hypothetical protein